MAIMTVKSESESQSFVILWTVDYQASLSMEFSRQEYWIELPIPSPGDLPDPGTEPWSSTLWTEVLLSETSGKSDVRVGR